MLSWKAHPQDLNGHRRRRKTLHPPELSRSEDKYQHRLRGKTNHAAHSRTRESELGDTTLATLDFRPAGDGRPGQPRVEKFESKSF